MSSSEGLSWISWFCGRKGNEFFCEVEEEYIKDKFNLTGLNEQLFPNYKKALDLIMDVEADTGSGDSDSSLKEGTPSDVVEQAAEMLYGLIHARYILTNKGIFDMMVKYKRADFGTCPRYFCEPETYLLPIGLSDAPGEAMVKLYCPKCRDVYVPRSSRHRSIDGCYFGTGFPHMFFMVHPEERPQSPPKEFIPTLYGFKIHPLAYRHQHETREKMPAEKKVNGVISINEKKKQLP